MECPNPLKVWVKATLGNIMGVTHMTPDHWLFSAYFTHFGHYFNSPYLKSFLKSKKFFYNRKPDM